MIERFGMNMHIHGISDIVVEEMDGTDSGTAWRKVLFMCGDEQVFEVAVFPVEDRNGVVWLTVKGEPRLRAIAEAADPDRREFQPDTDLNDVLRDIALLQRQAD